MIHAIFVTQEMNKNYLERGSVVEETPKISMHWNT